MLNRRERKKSVEVEIKEADSSYRVNIGVVALEALDALAAAHVPNEDELVAAARHERVASLAGREVDGHDAVRMSVEVLE